jgi:uncharacterized protein YbjT (DUF2867 family)
MSSSNKRIVAVTGATGQQGGSLVHALIQDGGFHIRAVTRDKNKEKAKELQEHGVEVIEADFNDKRSLVKAFSGAHAVFAMTNFWQPDVMSQPGKETEHGNNIADAAKEAGVEQFICSVLHDAEKISGGKLKVRHFTDKHHFEEHAASLKFKFFTPFYPACYFQNLNNFFPPEKLSDGSYVFRNTIKHDAQIPMFDVHDTGYLVLAALKDPERWNHRKIYGAAGYYTMKQVANCFGEAKGVNARHETISEQEARKNGASDETLETFAWFNWGYYNGEDISSAFHAYPGLTTLQEWCQREYGTEGEGSGMQGLEKTREGLQAREKGKHGREEKGKLGREEKGMKSREGQQSLESMQGQQGMQGIQSREGMQEQQGLQGLQGREGKQGLQGREGQQGLQGREGQQGLQGREGMQGQQGLQGQGMQGLQGREGQQGLQGREGMQGQGMQGLQGREGQGLQDREGMQGQQGLQGLQGREGQQGLQGREGIQGISEENLPSGQKQKQGQQQQQKQPMQEKNVQQQQPQEQQNIQQQKLQQGQGQGQGGQGLQKETEIHKSSQKQSSSEQQSFQQQQRSTRS